MPPGNFAGSGREFILGLGVENRGGSPKGNYKGQLIGFIPSSLNDFQHHVCVCVQEGSPNHLVCFRDQVSA